MSVTPPGLKSWPASTIGKATSPEIAGGHRSKGPGWVKMRIRGGDVIDVHTDSIRDVIRHHGGVVVNSKGKDASAAVETPEVSETNGSSPVEFVETAEVKEPNELDDLRAEYTKRSGKDWNKQWGKRVLENKIKDLDPQPSDNPGDIVETVSPVEGDE